MSVAFAAATICDACHEIGGQQDLVFSLPQDLAVGLFSS